MTTDDAPLRNPGSRWHKAYVSAILGREVYKGAWHYGKARWVVTGSRPIEWCKSTSSC